MSVTKEKVRVQPQENNYSLVHLSDRVAVMTKALKRRGKGGRWARIQCGYFGFSSHQSAHAFAASVNERFGVEVTIRSPQRLTGCVVEAKVRDFDGLEKLAWNKATTISVQEARASLEGDWEEEFEATPEFEEQQRDWWAKNPHLFEDNPYSDGYSEEDARASYEDLRVTSLPWG
jgi:hypothetical protein